MKGAAPKESSTGFQSLPARKWKKPSLAKAGADKRTHTSTITPTIRRTAPPSRVVPVAKMRSPMCVSPRVPLPGARSVADPVMLVGRQHRLALHGHAAQRLLHLGHHRLGQRRVVERAGHLLAVMDR